MSQPTSERQAVAANALDEEQLNDFVVITGFSGAGKSTAMDVFEDAGYFCVDNLPPGMIGSLADLFMHEGSRVEYAAIVCDVRGGSYFTELDQKLDSLDAANVNYRVLYLEADEQTLVNRYKETRRRHPLAPDSGSISDGIRPSMHESTSPANPLAFESVVRPDSLTVNDSVTLPRADASFARYVL